MDHNVIRNTSLDARIASAIKRNTHAIALSVMANHDAHYPDSKLRSIPYNERIRWLESSISYIEQSIRENRTVTWSYAYYANIMGDFDPQTPLFIELSNYYENILPMEDSILPFVWEEFQPDSQLALAAIRRLREHVMLFIQSNVKVLQARVARQIKQGIETARLRERNHAGQEAQDILNEVTSSFKDKAILIYGAVSEGRISEALDLLTAMKLLISDVSERTLTANRSSASFSQADLFLDGNAFSFKSADLDQNPLMEQRPSSEEPRLSSEFAYYDITKREADVLRGITEGKTNAEIADDLDLSVGTIRNYASSLLEKLHAENRTQLAVYAVKAGLV